jgi:hypothetical protein
MEWEKDLPEGPGFETSEVSWLPFGKAKEKLKSDGERKILDFAKQALNSGIQENLV